MSHRVGTVLALTSVYVGLLGAFLYLWWAFNQFVYTASQHF